MENKQYLIEIAVGDSKLKSSLKKALEDPAVQKQMGILGQGITEHLEKDIGKAASILGKVDWASLLGEKDFEHLQQLVAQTVSANKDLIKSFVKSGDTQGIRDTIELVSELGAELRAIDPDFTAKGLARSMGSFIKTLKPISDALSQMTDGSERFAGSLQSLMDNFDTTTINKRIKETSELADGMLASLGSPAARKALRAVLGEAEKLEDKILDSQSMDAYLAKFTTAKAIAEQMADVMDQLNKINPKLQPKNTMELLQRLEGLQGKLKPILPTLDGSSIKKGTEAVTHELDATLEKITDKLEKSFNKTIEEKLGSIKVKVEVPTEEKLIADINDVIEKVNAKGTNSFKLVGAESAINEAQRKILENTATWHERMKDYLKFDKKEDIKLDLGAKLREMGSNVGEDFKRSIEEYFDDPNNRVAVPVELVLTGKNKAIIEGEGGITVNGNMTSGGGGEITAESLAKALTTPIEVKVQEEAKEENKPTGKLISIDRGSAFAQEVVDVFEEIFKVLERGGANAQKIETFFDSKGVDLDKLKEMPDAIRPNALIDAYETFLERGEASILDQARSLASNTKIQATTGFAKLLRDSVLRFDLKSISESEDVKRDAVRDLIKTNYIPKSKTQESIYQLINTKNEKYTIPEIDDLNKLMSDLPEHWGKLGKEFLPAIDAIKKLRSEIADPTNESEIARFKKDIDELANQILPLYGEMKDFMSGYQIGVFNKGHNPHNKNADYEVHGGVFSGGKLERNWDKVDYFELYDDPSGHASKGNRKDAMDNVSRLERYDLRRRAAEAFYRTKRPEKTSPLAEDVEVPKFEPKVKPDEELKEIEGYKKAAENRAKAIEDARKASVEEAKAAEELRKQQLEADKKRRTALKGQKTKNENKLKNASTDNQELLNLEREATEKLQESEQAYSLYSQYLDESIAVGKNGDFDKSMELDNKSQQEYLRYERLIHEHDNLNELIVGKRSSISLDAEKLAKQNEQFEKEIKELDSRIATNSVEPAKTPTTLQQLAQLPKESEIQQMRDDVDAIDKKIEEAQKNAEELDKFVEKNFKAEKKPNIDYTKSEKNNQSKSQTLNTRLATLSQLLNEKDRTKWASSTGLTDKDKDAASKLLNDRKIEQLINGEQGLGMPINSNLENIAKDRIHAYQEGLNKIDEFLLKHQKQTIKYASDDEDWLEFSGLSKLSKLQEQRDALEERRRRSKNNKLSDKDARLLDEVNAEIAKDANIRKVLTGTFEGSKEEETAIRAKINEFKTRMVDAGKSYVVDYIDMWSDKNLRELMSKDDVQTRTSTDAKGDSILQEFYRRIVEGGVGKRDETFEYLRRESEKYQKNVAKDEVSLEKIVMSAWEQTESLDVKNQTSTDRVKEKYQTYVDQWLYTIQQNMYDVLFGELDDNDKALKIKKNDELRGLIGSYASKYLKEFGETLLTEEQNAILKSSDLTYQSFKRENETSLTAERKTKQADLDAVIKEKSELLKQRRFDLLQQISKRTEKGEDTASLEKLLTEVENELVKYSDELPHLLRNKFEADLLNAKNATEEEWKQFKARATQRQNEHNATKYTELKGKQGALLAEITQTHKDGGSTSALVKELDALNKELVEYEVIAARTQDVEKAILPSDASVGTIRRYNTEMRELVKLQQERAKLAAQEEGVVEKDAEIAKQRRALLKTIREQTSSDRARAAEYDPKNQATQFIENTGKALYQLEQQAKEAENHLNTVNDNLQKIQSDDYKNSRVYRGRIDSLKNQDVAEYVRSNEYKAALKQAEANVDKEFGNYLTEQLGEDIAKQIVYEFSHNEDMANVDSILTSEDEAISLEKQRVKELLHQRDQLRAEYAKAHNETEREVVRAKMNNLRNQFKNDKIIGGMGITSRLAENAFSKAMAEARNNYTNSEAYKKLLTEAKENREKDIEAKLAADKEETQAKVQEIWNETKAHIKKLRRSTLANSEELRAAVEEQAKMDGMGDSAEYKNAIVDQVRESLIQQTIAAGQEEQRYYNQQYYAKARQMRSELSPAMYQKLNEEADRVAYDTVMTKIRELAGDKADLIKGLEAKRKGLIEKHTSGIVDRYREGLSMEETNMYKGVNIREQLAKELEHEAAFYEQKYREASGKLGVLLNERERAKTFGELGAIDSDNPEVARIRADAEARLTAEKTKQLELTERLTNLTAQNADHKMVQAVAAALKVTEKEIARLQLLAEGASEALSLRKTAKDEAEAAKIMTPEKLRLFYIDQIGQQKKLLENGTDRQKANAPEIIARFEQKLAEIEQKIEAEKPEAEKPQTVLDMITHAIRDGLAGVTAGGTVDLDASLYNIATETTLQEILRLLGGNGAVEYANQLKKELEAYRPRYEKEKSGGEVDAKTTRGNKNANRVNKWKQEQFDKLNEEGQRIYSELDAEVKLFTNSLKKHGKRGKMYYDAEFDFAKAIKNQVDVVKKQEKGTVKYVQEQAKLTALYQDYYKKTFGKGKPKKGQPNQGDWATKDEGLKKIKGLRELLLFTGDRAATLVGLGYGANGPTKSKETKADTNKTTPKTIEDGSTKQNNADVKDLTEALKAGVEQGIVEQGHEAEMMEYIKSQLAKKVAEDGLGRDVNDEVVPLKGETLQVVEDAIVNGFKRVASGEAMYSEISYAADTNGIVTDMRRGNMWSTQPAKANSIFGHTHLDDVLFGSNDFMSAFQNSGIIDVLELITPFAKYRIEGLSDIDPEELRSKFVALASVATLWEKLKLPNEQYNSIISNAIAEQGFKLTSTSIDMPKSSNFAVNHDLGYLQAISNHGFSLSAFEDVLFKVANDVRTNGYQFTKDSSFDKLITAIETIKNTQYSSQDLKDAALDALRPLLEEVFGADPTQQIANRYGSDLADRAAYNDKLANEIDLVEETFDAQGRTLFSKGSLYTFAPMNDGLYRDADVKTEVKEGVKEGVVESSKTTAPDKKTPYEIDPNSLIGKLQNTVGGDTNALAKQATLALVLSELQAISKKIPTVGKAGVKSSAQNLLEEFQKMAMGSAMDSKERVSNFDLVNGAMSPALSGAAHSISQKLLDTLSEQYGVGQGYRSQVHTHADSDQTWFSAKDLDHFKKNLGEFGADSIKQQVLLTKDNITVFDMTMVETAENAKKAIDILKAAGRDIDNETLEKLTELGARYQSKNLGTISAKGLMDMLGVKHYKNDGKVKNSTLTQEEIEQRKADFEAFAKRNADATNSQYVFKSFDGETLKYQLVDLEGHISKVVLAWDELQNKVRVVSDTSTSSIDATVKKIQQYKSEIASAQKELLLSEGDDASFVEAEQTVNDIVSKLDNTELTSEGRSKLLDELEEARQKLADEGEKLHKLISKNEKLRNGTNEVKQVVTQGTRVRSLVGDAIETEDQDGLQLFKVDDKAPKYLNDYVANYNELVKKQQEYIKNGEINNPKIQDALRVQADGVKKLGIAAMAAYKKTQELQEASDRWKSETYTDKAGVEHNLGGDKYVGGKMPDRAAMLQYAKEVLGADLASVKLNTTTGRLTGVLRKNNYVVADMAVQYDKSTGKMHLFQEKERESLSGLPGFLHGLKAKSKALIQYMMSMTSIYRVFGELRKGIQYVREIDLALTELKKVTDETEETYDKFLETAAKTGARLGSTISAVTEATATFAKLGYSMEQATEMAEAAIVYKNVGDNIASTEDAADSIISTMKGFKLEATESMRIVDRFNEVGNRFAITSQGIGEALRLSASALSEGSNSLDESIALITAANEVVNDPSSVGTALKTLTLRLRGSKTELEEAGLDIENMATTTSQLQAKLLALTGGQVDIMSDANTFKNTTQILREMAEAWEDMNDIQRASALELMGGRLLPLHIEICA